MKRCFPTTTLPPSATTARMLDRSGRATMTKLSSLCRRTSPGLLSPAMVIPVRLSIVNPEISVISFRCALQMAR